MTETGKLRGVFTIRTFASDADADAWKRGLPIQPLETIRIENGFLLTGIAELFAILIGGSTHVFSNANSEIGVGDSATAFANSQTDLVSVDGNTAYQACDTGYPQVVSSNLVFQATFATGSANFTWAEAVVKNSVSSICLDRVAQTMLTKTSATAVVVQVTISLA
jgi:hypothetical protein